MAGLLYKDFISIKGKRIVWIFTVCTILFLSLRLTFPGNVNANMAGGSMGIRETENGEFVAVTIGDFQDFLLMIPPMLLVACGLILPSIWTTSICKNDETNKTKQFVKSLPLEKNAYIASKYLFIGIAVYILFSLETMWIIIFDSVAGDNPAREIIITFSQLLVVVCGISLLLASIELPFFITLGVKRGSMIKTAILEGVAFLVIAYLFFGDLKIFERFNIYALANWCQEHIVIVLLISTLSPIADIFIFWLSYRITCKINQNRE
ncbi:MAG: ABC-2 transporter permease [Bacteroidales bacterium]|nr:ABC-2 transporter permease [Lachnoclostridium sp.]MCM1384920.1 ABC-2 transporter permease [Lachnoclostridium sp.]MCM1465630.1 ABC-2 transporter permease [Bacteroidales bacterium]